MKSSKDVPCLWALKTEILTDTELKSIEGDYNNH